MPDTLEAGGLREGLRLGRGDFRFLVDLAGQSVVKSSAQKEEQLGEGNEPGVCCTDLEISLPLTFASPRKGNSGGPPPQAVFGYGSVITPHLMNCYIK